MSRLIEKQSKQLSTYVALKLCPKVLRKPLSCWMGRDMGPKISHFSHLRPEWDYCLKFQFGCRHCSGYSTSLRACACLDPYARDVFRDALKSLTLKKPSTNSDWLQVFAFKCEIFRICVRRGVKQRECEFVFLCIWKECECWSEIIPVNCTIVEVRRYTCSAGIDFIYFMCLNRHTLII